MEKCQATGMLVNKDNVSKIMSSLFKVTPTVVSDEDGIRSTAYMNLAARTNSETDKIIIPPFCKAQEVAGTVEIICPSTTLSGGKLVNIKVELDATDTTVCIRSQKFKLGYPISITQSNIDGILFLVQNITLCSGVIINDTDKLPKSFTKEVLSTVQDENSVRQIVRSKSCKEMISFFAKTDTCATCADSYKHFRRRHEKLQETQAKDTTYAHVKKLKEDMGKTDEDSLLDPSIELVEEDHQDMTILLNDILSDEKAGSFKILLESQLQNFKKEVRQRRWDPKVISICLGIFLRSPQAYKTLMESGCLILPSKRLLQYYKNCVKQYPGFNPDNLSWMKKEAEQKNVSEFGMHGGILIDEMTIQDDLIINKKGDKWSLIGMVDMGETNNNIEILCSGKKKIQLATHALQFVFHGFTGFRWPVVYFGSTTATAHQLYNIFWECIDRLDSEGFTVDYVMLDGASANRAFIGIMLENPRTEKFVFRDIFDLQHSICAIQDIMHVLKKIRNNIESSKSENKTTSGRYLVIDNKPVIWDHWRECFQFNFQSGFFLHRKLTEEHIELTPSAKMRNHLAIHVLNKDMLFLMKSYQATLTNPERLSASVQLLEKTSVLVEVFCDENRPISNMCDPRVEELRKVLTFFNKWEQSIGESNRYIIGKNLMTQETRDDLNSSVSGFLSLCELKLGRGNSINPGYINSDLIENFFCQQRGIRNGLNTNPTLSQYGPSNTAIVLGQSSLSNKANSGKAAMPYNASTPCPLNPGQNKSARQKRRVIRRL